MTRIGLNVIFSRRNTSVLQQLKSYAGAEPHLRLRALVGLLLALERRRIAHPRLRTTPIFKEVLQQGFAAGGMGFRVQFARWQPKSSADAATSAKYGAPQDRADLNRRPDATARRAHWWRDGTVVKFAAQSRHTFPALFLFVNRDQPLTAPIEA